MHYVKKIEQCKWDVRSKTYFVYKCGICQNEKYFEWQKNFDTNQLKKCPNCGITNDTDNKEYLISKREDLVKQIKVLNEELSKINSQLEIIELQEIESKENPIESKTESQNISS